jgi:uncharacterized protein YggL (DUF469 family)
MTAVGNIGAVVPELNSVQFHDLTRRHAAITPDKFLRRLFDGAGAESVFHGAVLAGVRGMICTIALQRVGRHSKESQAESWMDATPASWKEKTGLDAQFS